MEKAEVARGRERAGSPFLSEVEVEREKKRERRNASPERESDAQILFSFKAQRETCNRES